MPVWLSEIAGMYKNFALFVSHFQASIFALNKRRVDVHKPYRMTVLTFHTSQQRSWVRMTRVWVRRIAGFFTLLDSLFQASFWALNRRRGDAHKLDRQTERLVNTTQQCAKLILASSSPKTSASQQCLRILLTCMSERDVCLIHLSKVNARLANKLMTGLQNCF